MHITFRTRQSNEKWPLAVLLMFWSNAIDVTLLDHWPPFPDFHILRTAKGAVRNACKSREMGRRTRIVIQSDERPLAKTLRQRSPTILADFISLLEEKKKKKKKKFKPLSKYLVWRQNLDMICAVERSSGRRWYGMLRASVWCFRIKLMLTTFSCKKRVPAVWTLDKSNTTYTFYCAQLKG
jgi:hypothetical protein